MLGKPIISLTDAAREKLQSLEDPSCPSCIRIDLKKGGCAGMEYSMDFTDKPLPGDEVLE